MVASGSQVLAARADHHTNAR